jgi:hypothetical protein
MFKLLTGLLSKYYRDYRAILGCLLLIQEVCAGRVPTFREDTLTCNAGKSGTKPGYALNTLT